MVRLRAGYRLFASNACVDREHVMIRSWGSEHNEFVAYSGAKSIHLLVNRTPYYFEGRPPAVESMFTMPRSLDLDVIRRRCISERNEECKLQARNEMVDTTTTIRTASNSREL